MRKKKDRDIDGMERQLNYPRNIEMWKLIYLRPSLIETEAVVLEDPLPEEKQQDVFELSSEEEREELQLHTKLEVNKLPGEELNY